MSNINYSIEYCYFYDEQDTALVMFELYNLLSKLKVGVNYVSIEQSHVGDVTLHVNYSFRRLRTLHPT